MVLKESQYICDIWYTCIVTYYWVHYHLISRVMCSIIIISFWNPWRVSWAIDLLQYNERVYGRAINSSIFLAIFETIQNNSDRYSNYSPNLISMDLNTMSLCLFAICFLLVRTCILYIETMATTSWLLILIKL